MALDLSSYLISTGETPASSSKMNNLINAIEAYVNALPGSSISGYPADATQFLNGGGTWTTPATAGDWAAAAGTFTSPAALAGNAHTYTMSTPSNLTGVIPVGSKIKVTQTTDKYFICTKLTSTVITLYGGTDYTLTGTNPTAVYYSTSRSPLGFPLSPLKWCETFTSTSQVTQSSPGNNTFYNLGSALLAVPTGAWQLTAMASYYASRPSSDSGTVSMFVALSTSASSVSDTEQFSTWRAGSLGDQGGTSNIRMIVTPRFSQTLVLTSATTYYLIVCQSEGTSVDSLQLLGSSGGNGAKTVIRATSIYI